MSWRGAVVLVLLLALGVVGGYAASLALASQPAASGVAEPVVAESPSVPIDPAPSIAPDPDIAPLATDLPTRKASIGTQLFRIHFPVPKGWRETPNSSIEKKWNVADNPPYTYVLRVEQVDGLHDSIARTIEERIEDLRDQEEGTEILAQEHDSLAYSYLADGHLRFGLLRWVNLTGSPFAEVEVAVTGREVDVPGMEALLDTVSDGMSEG